MNAWAAVGRPVARPVALASLMLGGMLLLSPCAQGADSASEDPGDLVCPSAPAKPATPPQAADPERMPTATELGPLAHAVVRPQPVIDPSSIPGFVLDEASGPSSRRIAVWGDSHVAAGPFMPTVIAALQSHGAVMTRFLPPSMGRANVRLPALRAYCIGPGWSTELAYTVREPLEVGPGLMNRTAQAGPDSYLWLDLRGSDRRAVVRQVQVVYRAAQGARVQISVNDGAEQPAVLDASSDSQTLTIRPAVSISTLKLRVSQGQLVLQGFILDPLRPARVTFDVFGLPSATAKGWANLDPGYLRQSLHGEAYDAMVLEYGTNEGGDVQFDADRYAIDLNAALQNLRKVFPAASCVLVGPPDRGVLSRPGGGRVDLLRYSRNARQITEAQARIGARFGCVEWNWQALMGGEGGSYGWALRRPPLMGPDLTHLTAAGYKLTGEALAHSLGF